MTASGNDGSVHRHGYIVLVSFNHIFSNGTYGFSGATTPPFRTAVFPKKHFRPSSRLLRIQPLHQYSFCGVAVAFEYGGRKGRVPRKALKILRGLDQVRRLMIANAFRLVRVARQETVRRSEVGRTGNPHEWTRTKPASIYFPFAGYSCRFAVLRLLDSLLSESASGHAQSFPPVVMPFRFASIRGFSSCVSHKPDMLG